MTPSEQEAEKRAILDKVNGVISQQKSPEETHPWAKLGGANPTPKQITAVLRQSVSDSDEMFLTENNAIKAIEIYWQQRLRAYIAEQGRKYSHTEVEALIKKALDDAAERAECEINYDYPNCPKPIIDKESITNIDVNQYLTK